MWARAFRLLGIVVGSVFIGYLIGSNTFGAGTTSFPPVPPKLLLFGGIIAVVLVVGLQIFFLVVRRRTY